MIRTDARHLARNVMGSYVALAVSFVATVLAMPYLVRQLGPERYGIFMLVNVALSYLALTDLGLGRATTRAVAAALGKGEEDRAGTIVLTSFVSLLTVGVVAGAAFVAATPVLLQQVFRLEPRLLVEASTVFHLSGAGFLVALARAPFGAVLEARQQFGVLSAIRAVSSVLNSVIPVAVLALGGSLPAIIGVLVLRDVLVLGVLLQLAWPTVWAARRPFTSAVAGELLWFGGWLTIQNVSEGMLRYAETLVVAALLPVAAVTYYSVPQDLFLRLGVLPAMIANVVFPAYATLQTHDPARLAALFWRSLKFLFVLMGFVLLFCVVFAHDMLVWWLGTDFARSAPVLQILALGGLLATPGWHLGVLLQGVGHVRATTLVTVGHLVARLALAWPLVGALGIEGAALAYLLAQVLAGLGFWMVARWTRVLPAVELQTRTIAGVGLGIVALVGLAVVARAAADATPAGALASGILFVASYAVFAWYGVFSRADRVLVRDLVKRPVAGHAVGDTARSR